MQYLPVLDFLKNNCLSWNEEVIKKESDLNDRCLKLLQVNQGLKLLEISQRLLEKSPDRLNDNIRVIKDLVLNTEEFIAWEKILSKYNDLSSNKPKIDIFIEYQNKPQNSNISRLISDLSDTEIKLSAGQFIFHSGIINHDKNLCVDKKIQIKRPLSTTLCPFSAIKAAESDFRIFQAGDCYLWQIKVVESPCVYFFDVVPEGGREAFDELEILVCSGFELKIDKITDIPSFKTSIGEKGGIVQMGYVPAKLIEASLFVTTSK